MIIGSRQLQTRSPPRRPPPEPSRQFGDTCGDCVTVSPGPLIVWNEREAFHGKHLEKWEQNFHKEALNFRRVLWGKEDGADAH